MDKLEIKQGSFMQQTQYFIPVEIDLSVIPARLGISDFFTCPDFLKFVFILLDSEFLPDLHFLCKIVLKPSNVIPLLLF
jgi:hypothetical protein